MRRLRVRDERSAVLPAECDRRAGLLWNGGDFRRSSGLITRPSPEVVPIRSLAPWICSARSLSCLGAPAQNILTSLADKLISGCVALGVAESLPFGGTSEPLRALVPPGCNPVERLRAAVLTARRCSSPAARLLGLVFGAVQRAHPGRIGRRSSWRHVAMKGLQTDAILP